MVHYKLTYFGVRGRAEVSRLIFAVAGQPFDDVRLTPEQFGALKASLPFGKVPLLEVDGRVIPESFSIARYLAKQFDLAGRNDYERAWVDALADQFKDYNEQFLAYMLIRIGFAQGDETKVKNEKAAPARDNFFPILEKRIHSNGTGYLVGNDLTWVDLLVAEHINLLNDKFSDFITGYPKSVEWAKRIFSHPKIAEYLKHRPDTPA